MKKQRSFLKWAGNKYNCIQHILASLPEGKRLVEPFAGSATVFMNTHYSRYLLAEGNKDLINLFCYIQREGISFINYCQELFSEFNNNKIQYNQIRDEFNQYPDNRIKAATFLYLNRHGYNGLCRYNQKGIYNVPFGRYVKPYFPLTEMLNFHQKSRQAEFILSDFRKTFEQAKRGDIIYCDPPYVPLSSSAYFSAYTDKKFGEEEQIFLAQLARESAAQGIPVIISNHDTKFTRNLYENSEIRSFDVIRAISCRANHRVPVKELVAIFNPKKCR